jgi:hypothetical protein
MMQEPLNLLIDFITLHIIFILLILLHELLFLLQVRLYTGKIQTLGLGIDFCGALDDIFFMA